MKPARDLEIIARLFSLEPERLEKFFAECLAAGREILGAEAGMVRGPGGEVLARSGDAAGGEIIAADVPMGAEFQGRIEFQGNPLLPHPNQTQYLYLIACAAGRAIHELELRSRLDHLERHDALTGLPNRLLLRERLEEALAEYSMRRDGMLAVVFIDLDRFKEINDTLGHAAGDALLQQIGARLQSCLPDGSLLARMGGDEFTALIPGLRDEDEIKDVVHKLLENVRLPSKVEGYDLAVTASIGVSFYPKDGKEAESLLRASDRAMYTVKYSGRNDVEFFKPAPPIRPRAKLEMETELRGALERGEFRMLFQPLVEIAGGLAGFEALLVWDHPTLGRITPDTFIPIAEETGIILPIGEWVIQQACRQAADWRTVSPHNVTLAVNVSTLQFEQPGFVDFVRATLKAFGELPAMELEITESVIIKDLAQSAERIEELRRIGVRTAIDDFGTKYSSLSYLRRLPVHSVKIDRSFLADVDEAGLAVLRAVVNLAHALNLVVTVEGVETEAQLSMAKAAGCDRAQGHLLGMPMDAQQARQLLASARVSAQVNPGPSAIGRA